jgi:hypothetical protein
MHSDSESLKPAIVRDRARRPGSRALRVADELRAVVVPADRLRCALAVVLGSVGAAADADRAELAGREARQAGRTVGTGYDCLRELGLKQRGLYATKDTFCTVVLEKMPDNTPWLEAQTGVRYETLRTHYATWIPGSSAHVCGVD